MSEDAVDVSSDANAIADYSPSLARWQEIVDKFPHYRQLPSTLYLLAYYGRTKDERKSLQYFLSITCANKYKWSDPPPAVPTREEAIAASDRKQLTNKYADCKPMDGADKDLLEHAWVRGIADYHFTIPGELDEAIAAYRKVVDTDPDSQLYAEALYKLAWSYYKRDFLLDSIKKFDESVVLYDKIKARGDTPPLELREESLQYIAVAFTDPWEGETDTDPVKAFDRAKEFYKGRENEPHVRDVWVAMGNAFMELQAYDQAVDSFRIAIGPPWELDPQNPVTHQQIVDAFEAKGDKFAADQAAAELATRYAPGSAWYTANEKDREAMDNQRRIAERALYAAARNTHSAATTLRKEWEANGGKDPQGKQDYLALYAKAVELYKTFIQQYPESDYVYDFTFYMAEALYFSEHYTEAVDQYVWVRDHRDLSQTHLLDAAQGVLASYEAEAEARGRGRHPATAQGADRRGAEGAAPAAPAPADPGHLPEVAAGVGQLPERRPRSQDRARAGHQRGPGQPGLPARRRRGRPVQEGDDASSAARRPTRPPRTACSACTRRPASSTSSRPTNDQFIKSGCGDAKSIELARSQNRSIDFKKANQLYGDKQYVPAGDAFYNYYKTAPAGDADLPTALYNSAVAYKLGDRPKTAISLFKEFTSNKDKAFRDSPFYLEAMRLTAVSYQSTYDYNTAIATYLDLHDRARRAKRAGMKPPPPIPGEPAAHVRPDLARRAVQRGGPVRAQPRLQEGDHAVQAVRPRGARPPQQRPVAVGDRLDLPPVGRRDRAERHLHPMATPLRQGPGQRGRLHLLVLRRGPAVAEEGPDPPGRRRRQGHDRGVEDQGLAQGHRRARAGPASGS